MEHINDALRYIVQAKHLLSKSLDDEKIVEEMYDLLDKAEEVLANTK